MITLILILLTQHKTTSDHQLTFKPFKLLKQVFCYGLRGYPSSEVTERIQTQKDVTYYIPSTILSRRFRHVGIANLIFTKTFIIYGINSSTQISILPRDEERKRRNLLPPKVTSNTYNFRNNKVFNMSKYRTNSFRATFIISSLINF